MWIALQVETTCMVCSSIILCQLTPPSPSPLPFPPSPWKFRVGLDDKLNIHHRRRNRGGRGGAMAPPTLWLAAGQKAQDTAYQQIFHRSDWVNSWNFMNKLNLLLVLKPKNLLLHCHTASLMQRLAWFKGNVGVVKNFRARFARCFLLAPPTLCMFLRLCSTRYTFNVLCR